MMEKYYHTIYLENIKIHSEQKQKKMMANVKGRFKHIKRHIGHLNPRTLDMNTINRYIKLRRKDLKPNGDHYADGSINFELNLLKAAVKVLGTGLKFNIKENMGDHTKLKQVPRETILTDSQYDNILQKFAEYDRADRYSSTYAFSLEVLKFTSIRWGQLQILEYDDIKSEKSDFVFVNKHRRCEYCKKDYFYYLWNKFCEELGYIKFNKFKKGEQESSILPHDIRLIFLRRG